MGWEDVTVGDEFRVLLEEILDRVEKNDTVRDRWDVKGDEAKGWVDVSYLSLVIANKVGRYTIEDASWLCSDIPSYINMAEYEAVIKGLNLALAWQIEILIYANEILQCNTSRLLSLALQHLPQLRIQMGIVINESNTKFQTSGRVCHPPPVNDVTLP